MNNSIPIGSYTLIDHEIFDSNGISTKTSPYLAGNLHYGRDASLSVLILFNETITSQKDILSYVGTYQVLNETTVVHKITLCSHQTMNNSFEERTFKIDGEYLFLGKDLADGKVFRGTWKKTPGEPGVI